jgi:hypothetical protein
VKFVGMKMSHYTMCFLMPSGSTFVVGGQKVNWSSCSASPSSFVGNRHLQAEPVLVQGGGDTGLWGMDAMDGAKCPSPRPQGLGTRSYNTVHCLHAGGPDLSESAGLPSEAAENGQVVSTGGGLAQDLY